MAIGARRHGLVRLLQFIALVALGALLRKVLASRLIIEGVINIASTPALPLLPHRGGFGLVWVEVDGLQLGCNRVGRALGYLLGNGVLVCFRAYH